MYINTIREARASEVSALRNCLKTLTSKSDKIKKHPISSSQKKQLDERFSAIAQRVESFSSAERSFCGKHVRFTSSSSEDEGSDYSADNDQNNNLLVGNCSNPSSQFGKGSERVSSCPYPSAVEEMARLGGKGDTEGHSLANNNLKNGFMEPPRKKRKSENATSTKSSSFRYKSVKKKDFMVSAAKIDLSITNESLQTFVTTWKETCREKKVAEVGV